MNSPLFDSHMRHEFQRLVGTLRCAVVCACLTVGASVHAQELNHLAADANSDLQKALAELTEARQSVEAERLPMARQLTASEQRLNDRKSEYAKAQRFQENQLVELNALKAEAKKRSEEVKYVESLLSEYTRAFRSRLHFVEEPRYQTLFESLDKATGSSELTLAQKFEERSQLLTASLKRVQSALGGEKLEAKALDAQGVVQPGQAALIGPVALFAANSGSLVGVLKQELNKAEPTVVPAEKDWQAGARSLVGSGAGQLILDPTLGNAFKLSALEEPMYERLSKGGLIMIPLLGLGLAAVLVALVKWFQLTRIRLATEADLQTVLKHLERGEKEGALSHARTILGPAGDLLATAVQHCEEKKEYIEEIVYEKMLAARAKLERGIPFLALAATTGPLMGLLGTVMGMIATFKLISSFGSGDPKQLAAGISEALICTATGMAVAIPSLLLHAFLSRKAKGIIGSMEQTAVGFINGVPQEKALLS